MFIYDNFDRNKSFTIKGWGRNGIDVMMEQGKKKFQFPCVLLAYHRNSARTL